jgi:preprotein translocase subunit SecY
VAFAFLEAIAFVLGGAILTAGNSLLTLFVIFQLALGGIIVILIDELVSKWGLGSGVSLIIAAGVGSSIFIALFSPFAVYQYEANGRTLTTIGIPTFENPPVGFVWRSLFSLIQADLSSFLIFLAPILATLLVFLIVIYVQNVGVEIPLTFAALRGFGRAWELKLLYTSVIPIILTSALLANLNLMANLSGSPEALSIMYFLSPPKSLLEQIFGGEFQTIEFLRALTYTTFLISFATLFSYFWANTAGMDPKSVAEQIEAIGMQIPGFRKSSRIMESVLSRYIPALAILSGIFIGLLAALADLTGAIGSGTGILLLVMIVYNYYEIFSRESLEEMPWFIRNFLVSK